MRLRGVFAENRKLSGPVRPFPHSLIVKIESGGVRMTNTVHFFLGANSGNGYQSLFGQLTDDRTLYDMVILKGPPGTGKSTFLKLVGEAMEAVGTAVEYIHCAGAPDSLDGVLLPELRCALADGTAPHLLEPRYPLAVQRCLDLGRLCDITAAKAARDEVIRLTDGEASAYGRAVHALKAARQVELDTASAVRRTVDWARLERRVEGIARRELRQRGTEAGTTALRFLGTVTHQGPVWRFDTVEALCPRVYELADSCGLAGGTLEYLRETAAERGWNTVACPAPEEPDRLEHLLIPGLGLAFVTSHPGMEWPGKAYRRLRLDAMAQPENRARVRFESRMARLLRQEAVAALGEAKEAHDALEALYHPYVDFDGVRTLAALETARLLAWQSSMR